MKKTSWAYNLTFTVIEELFAAVLQICGGPRKSVGNAPLATSGTLLAPGNPGLAPDLTQASLLELVLKPNSLLC